MEFWAKGPDVEELMLNTDETKKGGCPGETGEKRTKGCVGLKRAGRRAKS